MISDTLTFSLESVNEGITFDNTPIMVITGVTVMFVLIFIIMAVALYSEPGWLSTALSSLLTLGACALMVSLPYFYAHNDYSNDYKLNHDELANTCREDGYTCSFTGGRGSVDISNHQWMHDVTVTKGDYTYSLSEPTVNTDTQSHTGAVSVKVTKDA